MYIFFYDGSRLQKHNAINIFGLNIFYWWKHNKWKYNYNNFTAYIKTPPLIQYIRLKHMSEILIMTERMNHVIKSIAYQHYEIIIKYKFIVEIT